MTKLLFSEVLHCLVVLLCCELFVSADQIDNQMISSGAATRSRMKMYTSEK